MSDFSELENELRKLRPAQPSPVLFQRVEEAMTEDCGAFESNATRKRSRFTETPYNWLSLGLGLAAVAVLILFAVVTMERRHEREETITQTSTVPEARRVPREMERSALPDRFVSAGGAHVVYNTRDEGLQFANGSERPVRRVRYQTQQTWRWRNPETGASLRVSYPSEEIVLIPVSGQ
jgi:hypothetical protein